MDGRVLVVGIACAAVVTGCAGTSVGMHSSFGTTSATPSEAEQRFLDEMNGPETEMLQRETAADVLAVARATCDARRSGATPNQSYQRVNAAYHLRYRADLTTVVAYAPRFLCPDVH